MMTTRSGFIVTTVGSDILFVRVPVVGRLYAAAHTGIAFAVVLAHLPREGQQLTVMYAPDDVSYAYCKEAFSDNGKGLIAFSFFFGGLGLIFTITALRDRKNAMGY